MNIGQTLSKFGGRSLLKVKKYSPEILIGTGIVSMVSAGVLASKATIRAQKVMETHAENMLIINKIHDNPEEYKDEIEQTIEGGVYTDEQFRKDKALTYYHTGLGLAREYWPAFTLATAGVFCILSGSNILRKRNVALAAAYKIVETSFGEYRERVRDDVGEAKDFEYRYGKTRAKTIDEISTDEEGKEKKSKKKIDVIQDPNEYSQYARFFDSSCNDWTKNAEYNLMFLKGKQSYLNDMLQARGHVFLNEAYDELGIPRTGAGSQVGWVLSKDGDNFVDFGIYEDKARARDFVNGYEPVILLDFNVDGVIWDKI